jgi:hypothetical protein
MWGAMELGAMSRRDQAIAQRLKVWRLLDLGLYPIPVHPASRRPLVAWGEIDRLGYRPGLGERLGYNALVFEWWDRWPGAGAAVLTGLSRLLVIDVDPRHGGHHALARLVQRTPLPVTRIVRTRGGGIHVYYRTDRLVHSGTGALGRGLDVKSYRGLVVCPPTPGYSVLEPRSVAQAPAWLLARLKPVGLRRRGGVSGGLPLTDPAARAALDQALAAITTASVGERHRVTYRQACRAFAVTDSDQAEAELVAAAQRASEPSEWRDRERAVRDARAFVRDCQ